MVAHTVPHDQPVVVGDLNAVIETSRTGDESVIRIVGLGWRQRQLNPAPEHVLPRTNLAGEWFFFSKERDSHRLMWTTFNYVKAKLEVDHMPTRDPTLFTSLRISMGAEKSRNYYHRLLVGK